jgi:hypothetical protein
MLLNVPWSNVKNKNETNYSVTYISVPVLLAQMWTGYPEIFSFQNRFCNLIEFQMRNNIQNPISLVALSIMLEGIQQFA